MVLPRCSHIVAVCALLSLASAFFLQHNTDEHAPIALRTPVASETYVETSFTECATSGTCTFSLDSTGFDYANGAASVKFASGPRCDGSYALPAHFGSHNVGCLNSEFHSQDGSEFVLSLIELTWANDNNNPGSCNFFMRTDGQYFFDHDRFPFWVEWLDGDGATWHMHNVRANCKSPPGTPCTIVLNPPIIATAFRVKYTTCASGCPRGGCGGITLSAKAFAYQGEFGWDASTETTVKNVLESHTQPTDAPVSEATCTALLNETQSVMDKFGHWLTPKTGESVQDPVIRDGTEYRQITANGEVYNVVAAKRRLYSNGEGWLQKWLMCFSRGSLKEKCCVQKSFRPRRKPCADWCADHEKDWSKKCLWRAGFCAGCTGCDTVAGHNPNAKVEATAQARLRYF